MGRLIFTLISLGMAAVVTPVSCCCHMADKTKKEMALQNHSSYPKHQTTPNPIPVLVTVRKHKEFKTWKKTCLIPPATKRL